MTLQIILKQTKEVETHNYNNVRAYYFNKTFLEVFYESGRKRYVKLSSVLEIAEVEEEQLCT